MKQKQNKKRLDGSKLFNTLSGTVVLAVFVKETNKKYLVVWVKSNYSNY